MMMMMMMIVIMVIIIMTLTMYVKYIDVIPEMLILHSAILWGWCNTSYIECYLHKYSQ